MPFTFFYMPQTGMLFAYSVLDRSHSRSQPADMADGRQAPDKATGRFVQAEQSKGNNHWPVKDGKLESWNSGGGSGKKKQQRGNGHVLKV